jgi:anti-sigma-K factor RskA
MSENDDHTLPPNGDDIGAAEYVLGTMDAAARDAFAARIERDPMLARAIDAWRERLGPMTDEIPPVVPPMYLWHRVRARAGIPIDDGIAPREPDRWWDRIAVWRGLTMAGLAATAACVIALVALPRTQAPAVPPVAQSALPHPLRLVATMHDGKGRNTYMAAVDDDACTLVLMPLVRDPTPGEVPQVWLVADDGSSHSLGVGNDAPMQAMRVPVAMRPQLLAEGSLAVSMEPPGGSPTASPTGFVIGRGDLTHL